MAVSVNKASYFCLFCYKSIESLTELTDSSIIIKQFTSILNGYVRNHKTKDLIIPNDFLEKLSVVKNFLNCCDGCQDKIEGFCQKYEQLKILEIELDWKLDKLTEKINHANKIPTRWKSVVKVLEETFKNDLEKRSIGENTIRKFRQCVINAGVQRKKRSHPRVLLKRDKNLDEDLIQKKTAENLAKLNDFSNTEEFVIKKTEEAKRRELAAERKRFRELHKDKICPKCGKKLLTFRGLHLHLENHKDESEWKFECDECGRKFSARNELRLHLRVHTGEMPYKCRYCGKKFRVRKSYTGHLKSAHEDEEGIEEELKKKLGGKSKKTRDKEEKARKLLELTKVQENDLNRAVVNSDVEEFETENNRVTFKDPLIQIKYEPSTFVDLDQNDELNSLENRIDEINFKCPTCNKCFNSNYIFECHLERHKSPEEWKWKCAECSKKFPTRYNLRHHMEIHINKDVLLECEFCDKKFAIRKHLRQHMSRRHNTADKRDKKKNVEEYHKKLPHKCQYCDKRYGIRHNLRKHYATVHSNEKIPNNFNLPRQIKASSFSKCEICARKFVNLIKKKLHFKICHDTKGNSEVETFKCSEVDCKAYFLRAVQLKCHLKLEHFEGKRRKYSRAKSCRRKFPECEICGKKFLTSTKLRIHMVVHTKEKRFKCRFCEKEFGFQSSLGKHIREKHEVEENVEMDEIRSSIQIKIEKDDLVESEAICLNAMEYDDNVEILDKSTTILECEICTRKFTSLLTKDRHFSKCHDLTGNRDKEILICDEIGCEAYFFKLFQLRFHRRLEHGDKWEVAKLKKQNSKRGCFECTICGKVYSVKNSYDLHTLSHKDKSEWRFECKKCGKRWLTNAKLKIHMRVHTKEKGYKCRFCGRRFGYVGSYGNHLRAVHGDEEEVRKDNEMKRLEKKDEKNGIEIKVERFDDMVENIDICGTEIEYCNESDSLNEEVVEKEGDEKEVFSEDNTFGRKIESFGTGGFVQLEDLD